MKYRNRFLLLLCTASLLSLPAGCSDQDANHSLLFNGSFSDGETDGYTNGYTNLMDTALYHIGTNGKTSILEYETMSSSVLCDQPNCSHMTKDCLVNQIGSYLPLVANGSVYYFIDDIHEYGPTEEHIFDLKLGTTLYQYQFSTHQTEQIAHIDNVATDGNYQGVLLHDRTLWFIGNWYGREYDENGSYIASGNSGGRYELFSVDLTSKEVTSHGDLYNVEAIAEYYPGVTSSGCIALEGLYDNKIWFEVAFVDDGAFHYTSYVTYYDLDTGEYVGEPADYSAIDFKAISFLSKEYLVFSRDHEMSVCKAGTAEPIVIHDDAFYEDKMVAVFDDMLFANDKVFDLNTGECHTLSGRENTYVIAEYKDSYIIEKSSAPGAYKKIAKSEYLAG